MATVAVKGMSCRHCAAAATKAVSDLPGVADVRVDRATGMLAWRGDESREAVKAVREALKEAGFEVQ